MSQYGTDKPILDARLTGSDLFTAPAGVKTKFYFTFDFDCKFNGTEVYAWDSNAGDKIELITEYNAGAYGWKRYKKFGKEFNIFPNTLQKYILFPTEPSAGVRLVVEYDNTGLTEVKFSLNIFLFTDQEIVKPSILQEGEDW